MAISTNKGGLDLSGFDEAVKSEKKIDLSGFDDAVVKKKEESVAIPTGAVSQSGSVPTQPTSGSKPSQGKGFEGMPGGYVWAGGAATPTPTPVPAPKKKKEIYQEDSDNVLMNAIKRGLNQADLAAQMTAVGGDPTMKMNEEIARIQKENRQLKSSEAFQKFNNATSIGDAWSALTESPSSFATIVAELTLESLTAQAKHGLIRAGAGAATGAAVGSVIPGAGTVAGAGVGIITGLGLASLNLEYSGKMLEVFEEMGFDTTNPFELEKAFSDEKKVDEARSTALKKGIPVAVFDAISGGIAGRIATKPAKSILGKAATEAIELGTQAGLGMAGEATGQIVAGEKINPVSILAEGIGEFGPGSAEIIGGRVYRKIAQPKNPKEAVSTIVAAASPNADKAALVKDQIDLSLMSGEIDDVQAVEYANEAIKAIESDKTVPVQIEGIKRVDVLPIIIDKSDVQNEIFQLEKQKETTDAAFHPMIDDEINTRKTRIDELTKQIQSILTAKEEATTPELTSTDQIRLQILDDIFKDSTAQNKADALEQRMNNTEEISMTEINNVLDGLYKQVEMVMDNYFDNEAGQQYAQALLDKIDKIKSYEFATDKETAVVTERKAVQTARASLQETASVINLARAPRRTATITSEDGTTGTYSIEVGPDGTVTFEQQGAEPIQVGNVNDVNKTARIVETVLNEKGLPQSVSFSVTDQNGKLHTITVEAKANLKPQQLLDLAINIRANELGTVDPTDFDTAYEEVTRTITKPTTDAIQVETAGQVPVQPEAGTRQEMAEGKPQAKPQEVAQESVQGQVAENKKNSLGELNKAFEKMKTLGISQAVQNITKLFAASGLRVRVIMDSAEYGKITGAPGSQGIFKSEEGIIYLNPSLMEEGFGRTIVYHEGTHPIINIIRNTDRKTYDALVAGLKELRNSNKGVDQAFQWAEKTYEGYPAQTIEDESIVETLARIADGQISLDGIPTTVVDKIVDFFNAITLALGMGRVFSRNNLATTLSVAKDITKALQTGKGLERVVGRGKGDQYAFDGETQQRVTDVFEGILDKIGISYGKETKKGKKVTNSDVAKALNKYYKKEFKSIKVGDFSNKSVSIVSDYATDEIIFALERFGDKSGMGWYTLDFNDALDILSKLDPDINTDPEVKEIATVAIAIASNSTDVFTNLTRILYAIDRYKSNKTIPSDIGVGKGASAIKEGIERYNRLLNVFDGDVNALKEFMQTIRPVSESKKALVEKLGVKSWAQILKMGLGTDAEWSDTEVLPTSVIIFGPKIGAFYSNLSGLGGTPTIDRWCIRTIYRYFGDMRSKVLPSEMETFMKDNNLEGQSKGSVMSLMESHFNIFNQILGGKGEFKGLSKSERNPLLKPYRKGHSIWAKMENVVNEIEDGLTEKITNKAQYARDFRSFTKKTFEEVQNKVKQRTGMDLEISDIQAILWIFEKNLFGFMGVKQRDDSTYSSAANTITRYIDSGIWTLENVKNGKVKIDKNIIEQESSMGDIIGVEDTEYISGVENQNERLNSEVKERGQMSLAGTRMEGQEFKSTINGETVVLKPVDVDVVNGFYSPLEQEVFGSKQDKMPAKKWLDRFKGREEAKWTGLNDWLESQEGVVSKQDILDYMKENRIVVSEVVKGGKTITLSKMEWEKVTEDSDLYGDYDYISSDGKYRVQEQMGRLFLYERGLEGEDYYIDRINSINEDIKVNLSDKIKYFKYQLEGEKENYREVLVTLPSKIKPYSVIDNRDNSIVKTFDKYSDAVEFIESSRFGDNYDVKEDKSTTFQSSHFDEPNILVHLRMNERIDAEGNKVLFLEEVQSDWAQKGRREGFDLDKKQVEEKYNQAQSALSQIENKIENKYGKDWDLRGDIDEVLSKEDYENYRKAAGERAKWGNLLGKEYKTGIPTAPFVMNTSDWVKLAMRVALKEAVKSGANSIAWTTGEQQNDRFDLSKQVDQIDVIKVTDNSFDLVGRKGGKQLIGRMGIDKKELEALVGKDITEKAINGKEFFQGQDLMVGGKGMIGFYGNATKPGIVGQVASKLFGQEVGTVNIITLPKVPEGVTVADIYEAGGMEEYKKKLEYQSPQPSVTVTPQMKAEVKKGLPQFSLMGERDVAKRLEEVDITVLENIEKPISESKFENKYVAQHKDLLGKREGNWDKNKENILKSGFKEGINVNALPIYTGYERNVIDQRYGNRKGDIIYILPKEGVTEGPNGYKTKEGYKPQLSDVFAIEYDKQPTYEAYRNNLKNPSYIASAYIQAKQDGSNPELVKAVEDAIGEPTTTVSKAQVAGIRPTTREDVEAALSRGDRVIATLEMDDEPIEITSMAMVDRIDLDTTVIIPDVKGKMKKAFPKGQMSIFAPRGMMNTAEEAKKQYPLHQMLVEIGLDAYRNQGIRNYASFVTYAKQFDESINKNPYMERVWEDVTRIVNGKKPLIQNEQDYRDFLIKENDVPVANAERLKKRNYKSMVTRTKGALLDSRAELFKALSESSNRLWSIAANYVNVIGGMGSKSIYTANFLADGVFKGLSTKKEYLIGDQMQSESTIFNHMLVRIRVQEIQRKMQDKFDEFMDVDSKIKEIETASKDLKMYAREMDSLEKKYNKLKDKNTQEAIDMLDKINEYMDSIKVTQDLIKKEHGDLKVDKDGNYIVPSEYIDTRDNVRRYLDRNNMLIQDSNGKYSLGTYKFANNLNERTAFNELLQLQTAYPDLYEKLMQRADAYHQAFITLLDMQKDADMLSKESYDDMVKYKYVPMRYIGHMIEDIVVGDDLKINSEQSKLIKRLTGGSEENIDMAFDEALKFQAYMVVRAIAKNNAMQKIYEAAKSENFQGPFYEPDVTGVDADGNFKYGNLPAEDAIIYFFMDGKKMALATNKEIAMAFNGSNMPELPVADEVLGWAFLTTPFRAVTTNLNPGFGLAQLILDIPQALLTNEAYSNVTTGLPRILFRDLKLLTGKGVGELSKKLGIDMGFDKEWNELVMEAREYGGLITFTGMDNETMSITQAAEKAMDKKTGMLTNAFLAYRDKVEQFGTTMETVTRLAVYRKMRNNLISEYKKANNGKAPTGEDLDNIRTQAAATSLNVLNYNRGGTIIKPLNRALAYLNVAFQVPYSIAQYAKKNPYQFTLKAMEVAMWPALTTMLAYLSLDDDDKEKFVEIYNNYNEYEKFNYWHIVNPSWDGKDPESMIIRIKKPTILLPLVNPTEVGVMYAISGGKTLSPKDYLKNQLASDINAMQPVGWQLLSSAPSINALMKYFGNYDVYRKTPIIKNEKEMFDWKEGQTDENVGKFYKYVAEKTKYLGDTDRETFESISPARMDAAVKSAVGNYETNITTALPLMVTDYALSRMSSDYANFKDPAQTDEVKSFMDKAWEGVGLKKRFFAKVPEVNPRIYEELTFDKKMKNYMREEIRNMVDSIISEKQGREETISRIRNYYKEATKNNEYYDVKDLDRDLKTAYKYVDNQNWLKDKPKWYRTLIFAPDTESKILVFDISTKNMSDAERNSALADFYKKGFISEESEPMWVKYLQNVGK